MAASVHSLGSKLSNTYSITNEGRNSRRKLAQKRLKALRNAKKNPFFSSTRAVLHVLLAVMLFVLFVCVCKGHGQQTSPMQSASLPNLSSLQSTPKTNSTQSAGELNALGTTGHGQQTSPTQ